MAAKIMEENGVRITGLYSESIRQGFPNEPNVNSTGDLSSKAIAGLEAALASRTNPRKPLPRILLIGDSITSIYQNAIMKHLALREIGWDF